MADDTMPKKPRSAGLRGKPLKRGLSAMARHINGEHRSFATELANTGRQNIVLTKPMSEETLERLRAERKEALAGKRGRPPAESAQFVIWGPPRHSAEDAWDRQRCEAWGHDTVDWISRRFPDSPIIASALHMDEGSPHVHVQIFPRHIDPNGMVGYGLARADRASSNRLAGRPVEYNHEPQVQRGTEAAGEDMSLRLNSYHEEVGAKHGLERGTIGSDQKHAGVTIDESSRRHAEDRVLEAKRIEAKAKEQAKGLAEGTKKVVAEARKVRGAKKTVDRLAAQADVKARMEELDAMDRERAERDRLQDERDEALNERDAKLKADIEQAEKDAKEREARIQRTAEAERRRLDQMLTNAAHFFRHHLVKHRLKAKDIWPDTAFAKALDAGLTPAADEIDFTVQRQVPEQAPAKPGAALDELVRRLDEERGSPSDRSEQPKRR